MSFIKSALIVGGGIGGLTTAIALRRVGIEVTVLERTTTFREIGAGLWLWQNALTALEMLGLADAVRTAGIEDAHGGIRSWRGDILVTRVPAQCNHVSMAILRSDLQKVLIDALPAEIIHNGAVCVNVRQDSNSVIVDLVDGTQYNADILIAADGIHSTIRASLFDYAKPVYAGFTAWRAVTTFRHDDIPSGVSWGNGARFGVMPITHGRVNWFAGWNLLANTADPLDGHKKILIHQFRNWFEPIPAMIEGTNEGDIIRNDIYRLPPLKRWSQGRVTLLGDAAHAMTPSIGQGACQAIEDALDLAFCVHTEPDPIAALQRYETRRRPHANAVARYAMMMDWLALWKNPLLCDLRNAAIKSVPAALRDRQLNWIIDRPRF